MTRSDGQGASNKQPIALRTGRLFKDPAAAIDLLVHHSIIIELDISSDGLEHAKTNTQSLGADGKATASDFERQLRN